MEVGLHVTLHSAMSHLDKDVKANIHLFLKGFGEKRIGFLNSTLKEFDERYSIHIHDVANIDVGEGVGLHGNKMPYVLFQIPHFISAEKVICLDADLLVLTDLRELFSFDLEEAVVGAVSGVTVQNCWPAERDFLSGIGVESSASYFNTGVVLIDTVQWKQRDLTRKCLDFASKHAEHLRTADQTVFNAVLSGQVALIPTKYNINCYPHTPSLDTMSNDGIYHFLGSPKPWDLFGEKLHSNYPLFKRHLAQTYFKSYKTYKSFSFEKLKRTYNIRRSYGKAIVKRVKSKKS